MSGIFPLEPELAAAVAEYAEPSLSNDLISAKNYLKSQCAATGDTVYDHLVDLVNWLLTHIPPDAADNFEQYSWRVKLDKFRADFPAGLRDVYLPPRQLPFVRKLQAMIEVVRLAAPKQDALEEEEPELELDEMEAPRVPDLALDNYYFKQAGYGLPDSECYNIYIALKLLAIKQPISSVRLFGKILGLRANYYVAETELTIDELDKRIREFELRDMPGEGEGEAAPEELAQEPTDLGAAGEHKEQLGEGEVKEAPPKERSPPELRPPPQSTWQPAPRVPTERPGQGTNKKVYWVCRNPGEDWVCLPDVTPQQIDVARCTVRCMTGDLDAEVATYPPFEGTERNYLRAQLARIAAATSVSPQGYYTFGGGEEEEDIDMEEAGVGAGDLNLNPMYAGHTLKDLLDPELSYWVHHAQYILKQGRITWWNPKVTAEDVEEEEEEEVAGVEPERGPSLMTPLSEDSKLDGLRLWTARSSSAVAPETALVVLRSNLWPGAIVVATTGKKSECIYVGWGLKYETHNYSPPPLPAIQYEYPVGPDIMEMMDPTFADEEMYRIAHLPPPPPPPMAGEGGNMEGGEEIEDEEDEE